MSATPQVLADLIRRPARPEHDAVVFPTSRTSYGDLCTQAAQTAWSLAALGVTRGTHVGILMPNSPDFVRVFWAVQLLGAVAVPINTRFRAGELRHVIGNADLSVLVTSDLIDEHVSLAERVRDAIPALGEADASEPLQLEEAPELRHVVLLGTSTAPGMIPGSMLQEGEREKDGEPPAAATSPDDTAVILFTSGTTAHPKGCLLSHRGILRVWTSMGDRLGVSPDDRVFDPLPMFHMGCIGPMVFTLATGATLQTMVHFEAGEALDFIETERSTWLYTMFPTVTTDLMRHPTFPERDLSQVRMLANVGPPETLRVMQEAFAPAVQIPGPFGMTEASGAITCEDPSATAELRVSTAGLPLPDTEVKVVDEAGQAVPAGATGQLLIRGVGVMKGYYRDAETTAATVSTDGWLHSGDLGHLRPDGRVVYEGRLKDMLKVGGENVAATEIESQLSGHPGVKLAQVIGRPDERLGEVPVAFVELAPGHRATAQELIDHCRQRLASFKVPREVRFVMQWPTSATKIQKFRLREQISKEG